MNYIYNDISIFQNTKEKHFPLIVDEYEPDTYNSLEHRVKQRFTEGGNKLVNIKLSDLSQVLLTRPMFRLHFLKLFIPYRLVLFTQYTITVKFCFIITAICISDHIWWYTCSKSLQTVSAAPQVLHWRGLPVFHWAWSSESYHC